MVAWGGKWSSLITWVANASLIIFTNKQSSLTPRYKKLVWLSGMANGVLKLKTKTIQYWFTIKIYIYSYLKWVFTKHNHSYKNNHAFIPLGSLSWFYFYYYYYFYDNSWLYGLFIFIVFLLGDKYNFLKIFSGHVMWDASVNDIGWNKRPWKRAMAAHQDSGAQAWLIILYMYHYVLSFVISMLIWKFLCFSFFSYCRMTHLTEELGAATTRIEAVKSP